MTILRNLTIAPMKLLKKNKAEAEEKAMQLLEQFKGRCGRRGSKGLFIVCMLSAAITGFADILTIE